MHRITCCCIIKVKKKCKIINDSENQNWKSTMSALSFPFTLLTFVSLCCLSLTNQKPEPFVLFFLVYFLDEPQPFVLSFLD